MVCEQSLSLSDSRPRVYLLLATAFALAGYAWLMLFPLLVFASVPGIYQAVFSAEGIAWALVLTWLVIGVLAALVSYRARMARYARVIEAQKRNMESGMSREEAEMAASETNASEQQVRVGGR